MAKRSGKWGLVVAVVCIAGIALMVMRVDLARTIFAQSADAKTPGSASKPPARSDTAKQDIQARHGFDPSNLDKTCKPCADFYQFAVGGWMAKNPIPAEFPMWGSFVELNDQNEKVLRDILEQAASATSAAAGTSERKIGDFYATCMDTAKIDAQGITPLQPEFERISAIRDVAGLTGEVMRLQQSGANAMFAFGSNQDFKDSTKVIAEADQGGLGMPDRDYYTRDDEHSKQLREQYVKHVAKLFELLGDSPEKAVSESNTVMGIETALAKSSMDNVKLRDPNAIYHKMTLKQLKELTPNFSWEDYLRVVGQPQVKELNIGQPDFFKELNKQLTATPLDEWKTYLRWHLMNATAAAVSAPFVDENFNFKGRVLTGAKEIQPRWKRCVQSTDKNLGEALGQVYVQKHFPPEAKARALEMVHNLVSALRDDLQTLDWMGPATRKQATTKLEAFAVKIGYPDKWRDYTGLQIDHGSYVEDVLRAQRFEFQRDLSKIGKPVDRAEWGMTPPTVNAYNNGQLNEIVFPAGILQPPFYDPKADDAYNYGGMGAAIGHEITHGFDDEGRQFDLHGNLKDWWAPEDAKNFDDRAKCVIQQFDAYVVEGDLHENGRLVVGESIADLGGLSIAYTAYQRSLQGKARSQVIDGFTPEQRFFLGWARVWAANVRPEFARLMANTNPHPLPRFRTNGPLANFAAFAKAYGCKKGDPMVRENVCRIW
ncbi:MAG TPA: M13 family metallopeptidase [Candidatus Dormibacteraeota bacterium]|nr:M13 family metallopeptidase [Candidatus Dormibacteraeota bacterium]